MRQSGVIIGLVSLVILIGIRLIYLQVYKHQDFVDLTTNQIEREETIPAFRGSIYDRNNTPLALSIRRHAVYAVPDAIVDKRAWALKLAGPLNMSVTAVLKKITPPGSFVWLARQVSDTQALRPFDDHTLGILPDYKRLYPQATLAAHVIGFTGIDSQGLSGIEYYYDEALRGKPGVLLLERDNLGFPLASGKKTVRKPAINGDKLILTLDASVQYQVEQYLAAGITAMKADHGQAVVMNPETGEILAMASYPGFDLNAWHETTPIPYTNPVITNIYEPGSVFKLITMASALEEGIVSPDSVLTVPEELSIETDIIKEAHARDSGESDEKSLHEIITESLNVGISLLSQDLGPDKFFRYLHHFGLDRATQIGLPGETAGLLRPVSQWQPIDTATIAFGQGIGVSSLQLITAISAIVNDGILVQPHIINGIINDRDTTYKRSHRINRRRILTPETARAIQSMMVGVIESGTGMQLAIPNHRIGGKTGTANKPSPDGGYYKDQYVSTFVGFLSDPKLVILVMVDNPKESIWGSTVAGPIFRNIALSLLQYQID